MSFILSNLNFISFYLALNIALSFAISRNKNLMIFSGFYSIILSLFLSFYLVKLKLQQNGENISSLPSNSMFYIVIFVLTAFILAFYLIYRIDTVYLVEKIFPSKSKDTEEKDISKTKSSTNYIINHVNERKSEDLKIKESNDKSHGIINLHNYQYTYNNKRRAEENDYRNSQKNSHYKNDDYQNKYDRYQSFTNNECKRSNNNDFYNKKALERENDFKHKTNQFNEHMLNEVGNIKNHINSAINNIDKDFERKIDLIESKFKKNMDSSMKQIFDFFEKEINNNKCIIEENLNNKLSFQRETIASDIQNTKMQIKNIEEKIDQELLNSKQNVNKIIQDVNQNYSKIQDLIVNNTDTMIQKNNEMENRLQDMMNIKITEVQALNTAQNNNFKIELLSQIENKLLNIDNKYSEVLKSYEQIIQNIQHKQEELEEKNTKQREQIMNQVIENNNLNQSLIQKIESSQNEHHIYYTNLMKQLESEYNALRHTQESIVIENDNLKTLDEKIIEMNQFVKDQTMTNMVQIEKGIKHFEEKLSNLDDKFISKIDIDNISNENKNKIEKVNNEIQNTKQELQNFIDRITKLLEVTNAAMQKKN